MAEWQQKRYRADPPMIVLKSPNLTAHLIPRGATLAALWVRGNPRSLVLGFPDVASFKEATFYPGAIVGPVANRISQGKLEVGSQTFQMPLNDNVNCLHSGSRGIGGLDWEVSEKTNNRVTFTLNLPDGANGLPGARKIVARYAIQDLNTLSLMITATSDRNTVMNIAHHPYWTLDGGKDVSGHSLQVAASHYLPVGKQTLPSGEIRPVAGSDYDFRTARPVPVDRTLDANLCISSTRSQSPRDIAVLTGSNGIGLAIASTEPGLQVYNGSDLPCDGASALPNQRIGPFAGIALEPQGWPDAPNHPHFPSILLPRGKEYRQETRYQIFKN